MDTETKIPANIFQTLTEKINKERDETESALTKAQEELAKPVDNEVKLVTLQNALDALLDNEVSVAEKNQYLKKCISRITYHREQAVRAKGTGNWAGYIAAPIELDVKMMF